MKMSTKEEKSFIKVYLPSIITIAQSLTCVLNALHKNFGKLPEPPLQTAAVSFSSATGCFFSPCPSPCLMLFHSIVSAPTIPRHAIAKPT